MLVQGDRSMLLDHLGRATYKILYMDYQYIWILYDYRSACLNVSFSIRNLEHVACPEGRGSEV
jgi:hypothetical protein